MSAKLEIFGGRGQVTIDGSPATIDVPSRLLDIPQEGSRVSLASSAPVVHGSQADPQQPQPRHHAPVEWTPGRGAPVVHPNVDVKEGSQWDRKRVVCRRGTDEDTLTTSRRGRSRR